jgi:hypothetical protein
MARITRMQTEQKKAKVVKEEASTLLWALDLAIVDVILSRSFGRI